MTEAAGTQGGIIPPGTSASTVTIYCHNFLPAPRPLQRPRPAGARNCSPFLFRRIRSSGTGLPSRSVVDVAFPSSRHPSRFSGLGAASARFASGRSKQRSRRPEHSAGRANAKRCDEKMRRLRRIRPDEIIFVWTDGRLSECPHCPPYSRGTCVP